MGRLMLTGRRCERGWHVTSHNWYKKLGTLHTETNHLLAIVLFVCGTDSDRATSPSGATINGSIDASSSSLEASIPTQTNVGGCK